MISKAMLIALAVTERYSLDVFHMVVAVWLFAVGYLLYKRANRAMCQQRAMVVAAEVTPAEVPCFSSGACNSTGA
jgi:hypothetical protein